MLYTNYLKHGLMVCFGILGHCATASAAVTISEVMPCNTSTYLNTGNYNFSGYIEFANSGSDTVNLKGHTIDHYKQGKNGQELKWSWTIDKDFLVPGKGYNLLFADESNLQDHAPFKLDADGGQLVLQADQKVVFQTEYPKQVPGISYGACNGTTGYMEPTPYAANTKAHATLSRTKAPLFSEKGGMKTEGFLLTLTCADGGSTIYYTTNGDMPTTESAVYTDPILVDSTHSIRAMAVSDGKLHSATTTHSYIFPDEKHANCGPITLPIVNLVTNYAYFYDNTIGISVIGTNGVKGEKDCIRTKANHNQDWKRPVAFQYIVGGEQVFSQEVEAAVEGGCSRGEPIRSLSLKASKKSGASDMPYHFFQSKPTLFHKTLHLRNGGTAYKEVCFRDGLMQTFATGMNIDYQAYQPVAYYINGKYQGLMALNERTNADYIKTNHGVDEEDIDLVTLSDQLGVRASKGDLVAYKELTAYLKDNYQKDPGFLQGVEQRMDLDEYIDYQIFQQFIVNTDWPGNNTKIWCDRKNGGRFRWILFDTDFGFGLSGYSYLGTETKNMISWCVGSAPTQWANKQSWMTEIFLNLSKCPDFKKKFVTKSLIHLSTTFSQEHIKAVFDSIVGLVETEYCAYKGKSAAAASGAMRSFALKRAPYVLSHLKTYSVATGDAAFLLNANVDGATFTINGETVAGFDGRYLTGFESEIKAYPPVGYTFAGWQMSDPAAFGVKEAAEASAGNLPGKCTFSLLADGALTAIFVPETSAPNTLLINEICASSNAESKNADDYGKYPDWIEIRNYGNQPVDLAGMALSTSKNNLAMSVLPFGSEKTIVPAGGHKIVWAKGDAVDGALYLNFKLDIDKRKDVFLSNAEGEIISQGFYDAHNTNESYGWEKDEDKNWVVFGTCSDNGFAATPGSKNAANCSASEIIYNSEALAKARLQPNPATNAVTITCDEEMLCVEILNANGQAVMKTQAGGTCLTVNIAHLPKGIYIAKMTCNENVHVQKLVKE